MKTSIKLKTLEKINEVFSGVNYEEISHEKLAKLKLINKLLLNDDIKSVSVSIGREELKVYANDKFFKKGDNIINYLTIIIHTSDLPFDSVNEKKYYLLEVNGIQGIHHYLPTYYYWKSLLKPTFKNIKNFIHLQGLENEKVGGSFKLSIIPDNDSVETLIPPITVNVSPNVSYLEYNDESLTELLACLEDTINYLYNVKIKFRHLNNKIGGGHWKEFSKYTIDTISFINEIRKVVN